LAALCRKARDISIKAQSSVARGTLMAAERT